MKELVDYLCEQGCPEALAFRAFVEEIKAQCRQIPSEEVITSKQEVSNDDD